MSYDSTTLSFCRAIGTIGLGISTGLLASVPLLTFPPLFTVQTLSPRDRLHLWSQFYDVGAKVMGRTLAPITSVSLFLAAFLAHPPPTYMPSNFISLHRKWVLASSGLFMLSIVPYTFAVLMPTNKKLKDHEQEVLKDSANNGTVDTDTLIQEWVALHLGRVALGATAFGLAVAELVCV